MFRKLKTLSRRSLTDDLRYSDPRALFDLVRYAKHLGMWRGYRENQQRLRYVDVDADGKAEAEELAEKLKDGQMLLGFGEDQDGDG